MGALLLFGEPAFEIAEEASKHQLGVASSEDWIEDG